MDQRIEKDIKSSISQKKKEKGYIYFGVFMDIPVMA
jgi:hypothetical protein